MLLLVKHTVDFFARKEAATRHATSGAGPEQQYDLLMRWTVMGVLVFFSGFFPLLAYVFPLLPLMALGVKARLASPTSRLHLSIYPLLVTAYIDSDPAGRAWALAGSGWAALLGALARGAPRLFARLDEPQLLSLQRVLLLSLAQVEERLHGAEAEPAASLRLARAAVRSAVY